MGKRGAKVASPRAKNPTAQLRHTAALPARQPICNATNQYHQNTQGQPVAVAHPAQPPGRVELLDR